ncbi:hypothetical protein BFG57_02270 [Bacillus solimangrovi]|uniref:Ammonium transporter n=2 Tax=Bacillus solimangrovi TaxID=1305675 RepID=A0A1E5LFI7_9BACI|nr:hypothetical protein BFG57_02270 [Bacillus solimangrovi]
MVTVQTHLDFVWILIASILVFFMQAGFTALEAGLIRGKNSINVAMKNVSDLVVSSLIFAFIGFGIMFGQSVGGWFGQDSFFLMSFGQDPWDYAFMLFQIVFAGTAATIVSGAIAERVKFSIYLIGTFFIVTIIYPVFGHWAWGSLWKGDQTGWLERLGFMDFAGSTVVHAIGGWTAFAACLVIGPRIGKYDESGKSISFSPSNTVLAAIGVFIIWLGWFGFNAGSMTQANTSIALIALNTHLAAAGGGIGAMFISLFLSRKVRVEHLLNGVLSGLVSVTAGVNILGPLAATVIGVIGGMIVVFSIRFIEEKLKVDDAIGAISVHGVCGVWGTIGLTFFVEADKLVTGSFLTQLTVQTIGSVVAFAWAFVIGLVVYKGISLFTPLRPSKEDEIIGLNISEHGATNAMLETLTAMNEIAAIKGDLTRRMKVVNGEDTAEINQTFNRVLSTLNSLFNQVKKNSSYVHHSSSEILEYMNVLKLQTDTQMNDVHLAYEHIENTSNWLVNEIQLEDQVIASIQGAFAYMEEVADEIRTIKERVNDLSSIVTDISYVNGETVKSLVSFNDKISDIAKFSTESQGMIDTITYLSDKINVLALNAGIEATRAGKYGKGFVVVAQEIKQLADKSKSSTNNIRTVLGNTVDTIKDGENELTLFAETFDRLNLKFQLMPNAFSKIDNQVSRIYTCMCSFVENLQKVNEDTSKMQKGKLLQLETFESMHNKFQTVYDQMSESFDIVNGMTQQIQQMQAQSHSLKKSVDQFKTK